MSALLDKIHEFPPLDRTTTMVLEKLGDEESEMDEIATLLSNDPALTLIVLKLANSPVFGVTQKISSVQNACVLLGRYSIRNMLLSQLLLKNLKEIELETLDIHSIWKQSILTGCIAKNLTAPLDIKADTGLTSGMLLKFGKMVLAWADEAAYAKVLELSARKRCQDFEAEQRILEINHAAIALELLSNWFIPNEITKAIAYYPIQAKKQTHPLASVLYVANALAIGLSYQTTLDKVMPLLTPELLDYIKRSPDSIPKLLAKSREEAKQLIVV